MRLSPHARISEEPCTPPNQKIATPWNPPAAPKRQQHSLTSWYSRPHQDSLDLREYFLGLPKGEPLMAKMPLTGTLAR